MIRVLLRAVLSLLLTLACASVLVFAAMQVLPGDPAEVMLGVNARPDTLAALRAQLGLDQPLPVRYAAWAAGFFSGDLGTSNTYAVPVMELVRERLSVSLPLALLALALTVAIALPLGMLAAARRGRLADRGVLLVTQLGIAVPNFWFAMLLVLLFAITWRWLPPGGFPGWEAGVLPALAALLLPAVALALPQGAILAQVMRSALIDTLDQDFIRTARAKGLTRGEALRRHALRNALIPVLTVVGLQFSFLLAGTIIIENVFFLPGLGRLVFQAINQRDLAVVQSVVMLLVASVVIVNFLVNLAYAIVDPRLRGRA
ncbi:peptide/nickel transport system permease protein [Pseudochelatococcus lubricantis]|uniref:Peptide/nickel transport system permease protein n=1 Tax=Pseudochelatococcus lubricantis TaxID=1538102 RepID=A0ABX0UWP1_9HYPH|nr:ABC transporter permease [Pseudochelatococcus lubricantis]NIJ56270.1 peptide/nickel transport system permease protein [Pseudochelatococcus lubricantis]